MYRVIIRKEEQDRDTQELTVTKTTFDGKLHLVGSDAVDE
jgi:hypothetical protein